MIFVTKALAPAKIVNVDVFPEESKMLVAVADDKLSLAIGKAGQNARLAAKLTGWKINIMSETEYEALKKSEEEERVDIETVTDIAPRMIQKLLQAGFETAQDVVESKTERLIRIEGIGEKTAEKIRSYCETAITVAAEERAKSMAEEDSGQAAEMEFSPDDEATPRPEDY
jgi:N utilization substance protein A